jgi:hypothetical protein
MDNTVVIVGFSYPPMGGASSERISAMAREFSREGWFVNVFYSGEKKRCAFVDERALDIVPDCVKATSVGYPEWYDALQMGLVRKAVSRLFLDIPRPRMPWVVRLASKLKHELRSIQPDLLITSSPPHSVHTLGYWFKKRHNIPWIMDLRDPWYGDDALSHITPIHEYMSDKCCELCFEAADIVTANTETSRDKILKENDIAPKLYTVTNGYWSELFKNTESDSRNNSISILYAGGTYGGKANKYLQSLADKIDIESGNSSHISIRILGETTSSTGSGNVGPNELGFVSVKKVPRYLCSADLLVVYTPPHYDNTGRIMLKSYGYARSGKPVLFIGPRNHTYDFLNQHVYVRRFDRSSVSSASEWIISNTSELKGNKYDVDNSNNTKLAERSFASQMSKLTNIANDLISIKE